VTSLTRTPLPLTNI